VAAPSSLEPINDCSIAFRHIAPPGVTLDMCRRPDYWRNNVRECGRSRIAGQRPWNKIEIISEDGSWEAELRILSAADGLVHTRVIREWYVESKPGRKPSLPDGYSIEYVTGNGWRALDAAGMIVSSNLPIEDDAVRAAAHHGRKVA
jgi:hypothetical protein